MQFHRSRSIQLAVIVLCLSIVALSEPTIKEAARAPYLQRMTPTSVVVKMEDRGEGGR